MKKLLFLLILTVTPAFIGCANAQVAPTNFEVAVSWTAPAASGSWTGCTATSPCGYVISRVTLTAGTSACPVANAASPNYTPLNTASPASGTTYADTAASGLTVCYVAQTEQGSAVSQPSNTVGPFAVPASPLAPPLSANQTVADAKPAPLPTGSSDAPILTAALRPIR